MDILSQTFRYSVFDHSVEELSIKFRIILCMQVLAISLDVSTCTFGAYNFIYCYRQHVLTPTNMYRFPSFRIKNFVLFLKACLSSF